MKLIDRDELLRNIEADIDISVTGVRNMEAVKCCLQNILDDVKESPVVMEWIPVTERLPKNPAQVLVTYSWGEVTVGEYWNNGEGWGIDGEEVLAWMPLPEPYKKGEEHETD